MKASFCQPSTAMQLLHQIATGINYAPMNTSIAIIFSASHIPLEWISQIDKCPSPIPGFSYDWSFNSSTTTDHYSLLNFNENLDIFLDRYFLPKFYQTVSEEYSHERDSLHASHPDYQIERQNLNKKYLEKIINLLGKTKMELENEHRQWSQGLGTPLGIVPVLACDMKKKSVMQYSQEILNTEENLCKINSARNWAPNPITGIALSLISSGINSNIISTAGLIMHLLNSCGMKSEKIAIGLAFQLGNTPTIGPETENAVFSGAISRIIYSLEVNMNLPFITFDVCVSLMHKLQQFQKEKLL